MPSNATPAAKAAPRRFAPGMRVERVARQSESDPYEFVMSTDAVDRMGDVVEIGGLDLAEFKHNPIALWQHDPDFPIGTWENVRKIGNQLVGKLELAAKGTHDLIDRLRELLEQRILQAVSIGFRALEIEYMDDSDPWSGLRFLKSELVECSLVSIPANPAALRIRAMHPNPHDAEIFSSISGHPGARGSSERTGTGRPITRRQLASPQGTVKMPQTVAERLVAFKTRSATIDDELTQLEKVVTEEEREFSEEETTQIEALTAEKSAVVKNIEIYSTLENTLASKAQPAGAGTGSIGTGAPVQRAEARPRMKEEAGAMLYKMGVVTALAHVTKQPIESVIARRYAHDDRVGACMNYVIRTASNIADTTTPGWAAELVRHDVAAFMDELTNLSVFATLRARASTVSISLDGRGSVSIPGRTNRGNMKGAWVGEAGVIPVLQGTIAAALLEPTKLAGITTFSKELLNASNETIESVLRAGMREDTADILDVNLLDAVARVAGVRPAGLQVGANSAASLGPDAVGADLKAALAPIIAAGGGRDIVLILNPAQLLGLEFATNMLGLPAYPEIRQGNLAGRPFIASNNVPAGVVFVMDAAEFADGAGIPEFEVSEHATLTMANADGVAPTQAVTAAGVIGPENQVIPDGGIKVAGGPVGAGTAGHHAMSMFQQWSVALRLVVPVSWAMRRLGMVSVITGVDWGGEPVGP